MGNPTHQLTQVSVPATEASE